MRESRVVQINGVFLGLATSFPGGMWRFVATHETTRALNGVEGPSADWLGRIAWQAYLTAPIRKAA